MAKEFLTGKSYKRTATIAGYRVWQNDDNSIDVSESLSSQYPTVKAALRGLAEKVGFEYDPKWTVQQLGRKLLDFAEGK